MKFFRFLLLLVVATQAVSAHPQQAPCYDEQGNPLLVVTIMVKNEATVIQQTLKPYLDAQVEHFVVLDTGSTDATIEKAQEIFSSYGVTHAIIKQEPFVDYATSRNRALALAREAFPSAHFMVMPDAEWVMKNVPLLLHFCREHVDHTAAAYLVRIINNNSLDYPNHRLIRVASDAWFVGAVHEYVVGNLSSEYVPKDAYFDWRPTMLGHQKSQQRWLRDKEILLKELQVKPHDERAMFYLGQTCDCLGEHAEAITYYKKRGEMQGWDEERFMAWHRVAQVHERIGEWDQALSCYMKAYCVRPQRAEPLIKIAQHYINADEFAAAFLFASRAAEIPFPKDDQLFVEKQLYDFDRYDLLARAAWYLNEFGVGKRAAELAVIGSPEGCVEHARHNLSFYVKREQ